MTEIRALSDEAGYIASNDKYSVAVAILRNDSNGEYELCNRDYNMFSEPDEEFRSYDIGNCFLIFNKHEPIDLRFAKKWYD